MAHLCHYDGTKQELPLAILKIRIEFRFIGHSALPENLPQAFLFLGADGTFAAADAVIGAAAACRYHLGGKLPGLFFGELLEDAEKAPGIADFPVDAVIGARALEGSDVGRAEDAP